MLETGQGDGESHQNYPTPDCILVVTPRVGNSRHHLQSAWFLQPSICSSQFNSVDSAKNSFRFKGIALKLVIWKFSFLATLQRGGGGIWKEQYLKSSIKSIQLCNLISGILFWGSSEKLRPQKTHGNAKRNSVYVDKLINEAVAIAP